MGRRCVLKWFGDIGCPIKGRSKGYGDCFFQSEARSVRSISDIPPYGRTEQARSSSKCAPRHPSFGGAVTGFHHEPVDARWEHYPVYPGKPGLRSSNARTCLLVEIEGNNISTTPTIARTSVPRSHAPSRVGYLTR